MLKRVIDVVDGVNMFTLSENDKVIALKKVLRNSVFIMDDGIGKNQNIIKEYFSCGRRNNTSILYLSQSYSKTPKQLIRGNSNLKILFNQDELNLKDVYNDRCFGDVSFEEFKNFYTTC